MTTVTGHARLYFALDQAKRGVVGGGVSAFTGPLSSTHLDPKISKFHLQRQLGQDGARPPGYRL